MSLLFDVPPKAEPVYGVYRTCRKEKMPANDGCNVCECEVCTTNDWKKTDKFCLCSLKYCLDLGDEPMTNKDKILVAPSKLPGEKK